MFDAQKAETEADNLNVLMEMLSRKSNATGQGLVSYLEGILEVKDTNYWEYIHLDILLSLQSTKTANADEKVFIVYHQISELMFRLIIHEIEQLLQQELGDLDAAHQKIQRLNNYYQYLIHTFPILVDCIDKEAFHVFRKALYPASGQQSIQFRMIEILSTEIPNLIHYQFRSPLTGTETIESLYKRLYWQGMGQKSVTLQQFEEKYYDLIIAQSYKYKNRTLCHLVNANLESICNHEIFESLRKFDLNANVKWPMEHYKIVSHNLGRSKHVTTTGNTDWQKYLSPQYRKIIFFPSLWSDAEKEEWGVIP
jgi:tryptophan 2,3-dioxygenase